MKRFSHQMMLVGILAATAMTGCQTFNAPVVRGQSPSVPASPNTRTLYHTPIRSAADEAQDIYHEHHNTTTYHYNDRLAGGPASSYGQNCPPNAQGGGFHTSGAYQGYGENCPPGQRGCRNGYGHDKFSYAYQVPNDLVYPPSGPTGGLGGAVVYPYYTLRGPSDFFRQ
ncbi:hypothetical protein SH668x_002781 [Planctomicrobium sp. SH668]|uniref:hypothetical protein n=1 Tax=Planctomicrobium sp. SH668 TaxID=3448126 RepID=UPI003F5C66B2